MLKVIKRVLRLSGDLSKRIYASFVFSFIDSIVAMFPVGAVFYTLTKIQNNKAFTGNDWLVLFGILIISLVVRMVFKYLVYSFQSTAGFEFVSRTHEQLLSSSQTYLDMWKAHISAMDWSMNKEVEILC